MNTHDQSNKLTQRGSMFQNQTSFFKKVSSLLCPCFNKQDQTNNRAYIEQPSSIRSINKSANRQLFNPFFTSTSSDCYEGLGNKNKLYMSGSNNEANLSHKIQIQMPTRSLDEHRLQKLQSCQNQKNLYRRNRVKTVMYSVCKFDEDQLFSIGTDGNRVLIKISTVKIQPSSFAIKKYLLNDYQSSEMSINYEFQKYWSQRYNLFQKFDQGIKIDEQSWHFLVPEAVSEYIATKCEGAETILDGFCGVGSMSMKLANVCHNIISNDICHNKLKNLFHNAGIYQVDNIQMHQVNFLDIQVSPNVVFIHPPLLKLQPDAQQLDLWSFDPTLDKIIQKALSMSSNIVILVPPSIQLKNLCIAIHQKSMLNSRLGSTCSIKVQKIFYQGKIKYVALFYGPLVQKEIKLSDELNYIYRKLQPKDQKSFKHKKLLKIIREQYGISKLLNLAFDSQSFKQENQTPMQAFISLIRDKNIVSKNKLQRVLNEQEGLSLRNNLQSVEPAQLVDPSLQLQLQQQKCDQFILPEMQMQTQTQRTQSYYSNYTVLSQKQAKKLPRSSSSRNTHQDGDISGIITKINNGIRSTISNNNYHHSQYPPKPQPLETLSKKTTIKEEEQQNIP